MTSACMAAPCTAMRWWVAAAPTSCTQRMPCPPCGSKPAGPLAGCACLLWVCKPVLGSCWLRCSDFEAFTACVTCLAAAVALCLYEEHVLVAVGQGCSCGPSWGGACSIPFLVSPCRLLAAQEHQQLLAGRGLVMLSCAAVVALVASVLVHLLQLLCALSLWWCGCGGGAVCPAARTREHPAPCLTLFGFCAQLAVGWPLVLRGAARAQAAADAVPGSAGAHGVLCEGREHFCCCTVCAEQL